jgi:deoxyxylulose-5-phosphate synthase
MSGSPNERPLLSGLNFPADLRRLPSARLPGVAREPRGFLIDVASIRGGRLGAGLGAVELPIALHCAYRTPLFHIGFPDRPLCTARVNLSGH